MKWHGTSSAPHLDNATKPSRREQALDGASTVYKESIPLSDDGRALIQKSDSEKVFKRDMRALLIASAGSYRAIDDGLLSVYLKGDLSRFRHLQALRALACCAADDGRFERYTREMRRCNQVICRIRRELIRRIIVQADAKSSE